jgi:hypothetical protein
MSHVIPELKQQSMEWMHTSLPIKQKFKQTILTSKIMCKVFGRENACDILGLEAQQSMQVSTATHLRNCVVQSRTSDMACLVEVL